MVVKWVYQKALFFVRIVGRVGMFPNPTQYLKSKGRNHVLARNVDPTRLHIKKKWSKDCCLNKMIEKLLPDQDVRLNTLRKCLVK